MSWMNTTEGFGLASIRREGEKLDPIDYLSVYGEWPARDFYTEDERKRLDELDGWIWIDD